MSIFDGTVLNREILENNQFEKIDINKWMTSWSANIKFNDVKSESCTVSIIIDRDRDPSIFDVGIVISTGYRYYTKLVEIKDSIEFYTLLSQLKDIKYEYLVNEFRLV